MKREELIEQIRIKKTFLCVGLDPDTEKIPEYLLEEDTDLLRSLRLERNRKS
jgi:orotidine-5'-phosphate decarboxylase